MMTRTPEEIKKGLECHARPGGCDMGCPYVDVCDEYEGCPMSADALAYITRLESQNRCFKENKESCEKRMIDLAQRMPCWISVEERLPEGEVLAANFAPGTYGYKEYIIGHVFAARPTEPGGCYAESEHEILHDVTHWMPLPEPPAT